MYLTLVQLAESFGEEESTIQGWVEKEGLPAIQDRGRLLFDRGEVVAWAARQGRVAKAGFLAPERPTQDTAPRLVPMLRAGGIWRDVAPTEVLDVMEQVVSRLPGASEPVQKLLVQRLRAPDGISWAPVGDGLALPHFRSPVALGRDAGTFALIFLREPMTSVGAGPDGIPVTRLLFFVAPSPRAHLELLGQMSTALIRGDLRRLVLEGGADDAIFSAVERAESFRKEGGVGKGSP